MTPVALIDTNVWVSALLNPSGPPARLKDAWLEGQFEVVIALPILDEIGEVLRRPRIKRKYGIREEETVRYLRLIAARSILNRTARDSYTHAPEPECRSVRYAHENSGVQGRRAHSARYTECANLMHLGLVLRLDCPIPASAFHVFALTTLARARYKSRCFPYHCPGGNRESQRQSGNHQRKGRT